MDYGNSRGIAPLTSARQRNVHVGVNLIEYDLQQRKRDCRRSHE
jgi:hypothetical protein